MTREMGIDDYDILLKDEGSWFCVFPNNDKAREFLRGLHEAKLCKGLEPCQCRMNGSSNFDVTRGGARRLERDAERVGLAVIEV